MAFEENHNAVFNDEEEEEPLNHVVLDEEEEDDDVIADVDPDADDSPASSGVADTNSTSFAAIIPAVPLSSVAILPLSSAKTNGSDPLSPPPVVHALAGATTIVAATASAVVAVAATPVSERKPVDDSRRLFQRLWTDEDEIELLQGFLDHTAQRGTSWSGHHHDTTAFYDQIKSKIQLDCNKNQLVDKLRRLKKKYRNVVNRISSGKEFVFKSPHDQATFEISRKIWSNSIANRPEFDEDDQNPNPNGGASVSVNLNSADDHRTHCAFSMDFYSPDKMTMTMNMGTPSNRSRKRSRVKIEEKNPGNLNSSGHEAVNAPPVLGSVEETVKTSLSPLLKELVDNAMGGSGIRFGGGGGGATVIGSLALNAIPMNLQGMKFRNGGEMMEARWRKQQILELEVYSKRLELVQDQIKLAVEDLRTRRN